METFKIMATIDDALYEVEVKQLDPLHPRFQVFQDGNQIAELQRANDKWLGDEDTCLMPDDIANIGKTIDKRILKIG